MPTNRQLDHSFPAVLNLPAPLDIQWLKCFQLQGGFAPLTRGSAAGPRWGLCPQTPVIGSCTALAIVPPNHWPLPPPVILAPWAPHLFWQVYAYAPRAMRVAVLSVKNKNFKCKMHCLRLSVLLSIFRKEETVAVVVCCLVELYNTAIMTLLLTKTDVTPALLSHECATLSRDKVAESQTLLLSSCTLRLCRINKTQLLHHFSHFTSTVPKLWIHSISNLFLTRYSIDRTLSFCKTAY